MAELKEPLHEKEVKLYTRDGRMVCSVVIPDFQPPADALLWAGERTFFWREDLKQYREGMLFAVPPRCTKSWQEP